MVKCNYPKEKNQEVSTSISDLVSSTTENKKDSTSIWEEYDSEMNKITRPDNKTVAGIRELDKYLNEEYLDRKEDPLQWWQERSHVYPHLYAYIWKGFASLQHPCPVNACSRGPDKLLVNVERY